MTRRRSDETCPLSACFDRFTLTPEYAEGLARADAALARRAAEIAAILPADPAEAYHAMCQMGGMQAIAEAVVTEAAEGVSFPAPALFGGRVELASLLKSSRRWTERLQHAIRRERRSR